MPYSCELYGISAVHIAQDIHSLAETSALRIWSMRRLLASKLVITCALLVLVVLFIVWRSCCGFDPDAGCPVACPSAHRRRDAPGAMRHPPSSSVTFASISYELTCSLMALS